MKTISNKELNYSLQNSENFKKELDTDITDIVKKLSDLFIEYFKFITENIKLKKTVFSRFIIIRGLDTIVNIFNHILLYTKNIDVTYFHCQKAFYFYVEFVGQISEDEKMFLQLSSRDATRYVYNKTIFEINNEVRKANESISDYTHVKLDIINSYIELYKTLLLKLIYNDFNKEKIQNVQTIYIKLNNITNKSKIHLLNDIIEKLYCKIDEDNHFFQICLLILKKIGKQQDILDNCNSKFLSEDFDNKIKESADKFVNWFMS